MKLGVQLGHWSKDTRLASASGLYPLEAVEQLQLCESYGCDSVWVPESYHAEAFTYLSWIGAKTRRLKLGTSVVPIQARSPTLCAQAAITLDHLSKGRVQVGIGVSGVNVAEAWHGEKFTRPLARTREYVSVMRSVLAGVRPENTQGVYYRLPVEGGLSQRTNALKSTVRPYRFDLPILIGAMGPKNIALAAEIADGWLCAYMPLGAHKQCREWLDEGFARREARCTPSDFQTIVSVTTVIDDDLECAADKVRRVIAHSIGEMGSDQHNFQYDLFRRAGFEAEATRIRRLWQEGSYEAAAAAVPLALVDAVALVGPKARVQDHLVRWKEAGATTLVIRGTFDALRTVAESCQFSSSD